MNIIIMNNIISKINLWNKFCTTHGLSFYVDVTGIMQIREDRTLTMDL
jgi:hypothetical protein